MLRISNDRLLEGEFIPGAGDEFGEGGGPAAIPRRGLEEVGY